VRQELALGYLFGASAIAVAIAQPAWAQPTQVTGVRLNPSGGGVEVILEGSGGDRPQVFTVNRGNDVVADIVNAQLSLPGGQSFRENNPAPGITSVVVTPLDANSIRVVVTGSNSPPQVTIDQANSGGILLGYTTGGNTAAVPSTTTPPPPPSTAQRQPDVMVPNPDVTIDGLPAANNGRVSQQQPPPFLPRAVAPPVGDIAISNVIPGVEAINLGTGERIDRLVLRDAPVRDVLALLARAAGLNLAYVPGYDTSEDPGSPRTSVTRDFGELSEESTEAVEIGTRTISLDIQDESINDVFNYILRLAELESNRVGSTIFVGPRLPDSARNVVTRTLRLNQLELLPTLNFLVAQGAERNEVSTTTQIVTTGEGATAQQFTNTTTRVELLAADSLEEPYVGYAALPLKGVLISGDERTNSITIVGPPSKVQLATAMLSQLDIRQRQVAVNVKVIDVNLSNSDEFNTSFSFGINDTFFVNDGGAAAVNFGGYNPPSRASATQGLIVPPVINNPIQGDVQFDRENTINVPLTAPGSGGLFLRPLPPVSNNPLRVRVSDYEVFTVDNDGNIEVGSAEFSLPGLFKYPQRFLATLQAQILSRNAKILTDPTLVVQEGQQASVALTQQVVESIEVVFTDTNAGTRETRNAQFADVGLTLDVAVERIDDNGFVSLRLNPTVSSPIGQQDTGGGGFVTLVQTRSLDSGTIRLRDGQTLIVSGIIQDQDRTTVSKVPILGDLPLIGSLFRSTNKTNERAEVIVLLTPQILDDSDMANYGYGYSPGPEARQLMNR
jgi:type IV pilus assembly protein PilQ